MPFLKPSGPERGDPAGGTGFEACRAAVGTEGPPGMRGDQPLLKIPQQPTEHAAHDRAQGPRRECPPRIEKVRHLHLPIDDVAAARSKGAEGHMYRRFSRRFDREGMSRSHRTGNRRPWDGAKPGSLAFRKMSHAILSDGRSFKNTAAGDPAEPGFRPPDEVVSGTQSSSDVTFRKLEAFRKASVWYYIQTIS